MKIDNKYDIEQVVVLKTDTDKRQRIVTGIYIMKGGTLEYILGQSDHSSRHYEFELENYHEENRSVGFTQTQNKRK